MASVTSGMPGPSSRATTRRPCLLPAEVGRRTISPVPAYSRMLRPSSEMAVAITVWSLLAKPTRAASARPCWRAVTMSASQRMATRLSGTGERASVATAASLPFRPWGQPGQALFQVQGGCHALQVEAHLHHGEGHVGLDADDDRLGAAQPGHLGDAAQGTAGEGVETVIVGIQPDV